MTAELDNLRAALQWVDSAQPHHVAWLQLAYRLYWFWYLHSAVGEGRAAFERALAQTTADDRSSNFLIIAMQPANGRYQGEPVGGREKRFRLEWVDCSRRALRPERQVTYLHPT